MFNFEANLVEFARSCKRPILLSIQCTKSIISIFEKEQIMLKNFSRKELEVKDCYTYTAVRDTNANETDIIEFFNVTKNQTDPAMQQVNVTRSHKNVIRGVHISAFPKVVFCPVGRIYDVVVDMRPDSPTFKKWCGAWLDKDTHIVCPPFCAHGVFAAEEDSVICYYQGGTFFNHLDYAISSKDPDLQIQFPTPIDADDYVMSEKDLSSKCADEELWSKIKARMDDPINDMHTVTNSDIVLISTSTEVDNLPYLQLMNERKDHDQPLRAHWLDMNALNRESTRAALVSLRSKYGIIYQVQSESSYRSVSTDLLTEMMNIFSIARELQDKLVIVADGTTKEFSIISKLIENEGQGQVLLIDSKRVPINEIAQNAMNYLMP